MYSIYLFFYSISNINECPSKDKEACVATDDARRSAIAPSCDIPSRSRTVKLLAWEKDYYMC